MATRKASEDKAVEQPQPAAEPQPAEPQQEVAEPQDSEAGQEADESQVVLEDQRPPLPTLAGDGVGEVDEKVNPGQDELQETVDTAEDKGFLGVKTDPTPDRHYAVEGVIAGKPTPETERGKA